VLCVCVCVCQGVCLSQGHSFSRRYLTMHIYVLACAHASLCGCMYACTDMHTRVCTLMCVYIYTYVYVYMYDIYKYMYTYIYVCIYIYTYTCIYTHIHTCIMYTYMYTHTHICICICVCTYTSETSSESLNGRSTLSHIHTKISHAPLKNKSMQRDQENWAAKAPPLSRLETVTAGNFPHHS